MAATVSIDAVEWLRKQIEEAAPGALVSGSGAFGA